MNVCHLKNTQRSIPFIHGHLSNNSCKRGSNSHMGKLTNSLGELQLVPNLQPRWCPRFLKFDQMPPIHHVRDQV